MRSGVENVPGGRRDHDAASMTAMTLAESVRPASIVAWKDALRVRRESDALAILADIYRHHRPRMVEMIFTGACVFACRHCIYPADYAKHNRTGDTEALSRALTALGVDWGIDRYFYAGRAVTDAGAGLLVGLRKSMPEARIGLVDNGISIGPYRGRIVEAALDWIDVSLDGTREDHDRQRGRAGSFDDAVEGLEMIVRERWAPRVSVLSCLTALNARSLPEMIVQMNRLGVKNFIVSPVIVVPDLRPDPDLALSSGSLRAFVEELPHLATRLEDAYVEVVLHRAEHLAAVVAGTDETLERFESTEDHLVRMDAIGESDLCIRYFPTSLAGVLELVVNADGDVIAPLSVAHGRIPPDRIFGNVLVEDAGTIWERVAGPHGQQQYGSELLHEREHLMRNARRH